MLINIVCYDDGHVVNRLAHSFAKGMARTGECVRVSQFVDTAAINVYMPYYMLEPGVKTPRDICLFTHREDPEASPKAAKKAEFWDYCTKHADVCWCMSRATYAMVEPVAREKAICIAPPADPQFTGRALRLGVCAVQDPLGRKQHDAVETLRGIPGVKVEVTGGVVQWEHLPDWYEGIDYLVVLSNNEGGPMPVKEAIAMGKPVIAPDVGWCWEYPVIRYSSTAELISIVQHLAPKPDAWASACQRLLAACKGETHAHDLNLPPHDLRSRPGPSPGAQP